MACAKQTSNQSIKYMFSGYARETSNTPATETQQSILKLLGCHKLFTEQTVQPELSCRPQWNICYQTLKPGDTLVAWSLASIELELDYYLAITTDMAHNDIGFFLAEEAIMHGFSDLASQKTSHDKPRRTSYITPSDAAQAVELINKGVARDMVATIFDVDKRTLSHALKRLDQRKI